MFSKHEVRKVQIFRCKSWQKIDILQLEPGDVVRLKEPNGDQVMSEKTGAKEFVVKESPILVLHPITEVSGTAKYLHNRILKSKKERLKC